MTDSFYCYMHTFPDGKHYIGITCQSLKRRFDNGRGYTSKKMRAAIKKFNWKNVKTYVLLQNVSQDIAEKAEAIFIRALNTVDEGYNTLRYGYGGRYKTRQKPIEKQIESYYVRRIRRMYEGRIEHAKVNGNDPEEIRKLYAQTLDELRKDGYYIQTA